MLVLAYLRCFVECGPGWSGFLCCALFLEQILVACPRACVVVLGGVKLLWNFELALVWQFNFLVSEVLWVWLVLFSATGVLNHDASFKKVMHKYLYSPFSLKLQL